MESTRAAIEAGVAPIRVIEGVPVTACGHDQGKPCDALHIGRDREGVTAEDVIADESLIIREVAFAFALPGETAKGKLKELTPGNYAFACFVETPAGVPHFALGMLGEFQVA